ncbi:dTMP kinase, partial [Xanthomonas oryzae pv. oryzae]
MTIELKPGGLLIAIEGIDGAGKTTLARRLTTTLEAAGARVVLSKEPT